METEFFTYREGILHCEDLALPEIAQKIPTPFFLYSHQALETAFLDYKNAFAQLSPLLCFAMKANSSRAIIRSFVKLGGGVDVVSGGELYRALAAGADPKKIVLSGVGKTEAEIEFALKTGILQLNVESVEELEAIQKTGKRLGLKAPIALRVNPDIDPKTHPYISTGLKENKFGISWEEAGEVYAIAQGLSHIDIVGISCHIGSQLTELTPFVDSLKRVRELVLSLKQAGIPLKNLDLGGGLGIRYDDEVPPAKADYAKAITPLLKDLGLQLILEPGRSLVGNAGVLVTQVIYTKRGPEKSFAIANAAMNDLMRPTLYEAYHHIQPVIETTALPTQLTDVVGPICESGDFLGKDRLLPPLQSGDLLAVMSAGAYGSSMSSTYNSRPLLAEIMVKGKSFSIIRKSGSVEDLVKGEEIPQFLEN